jgi:hypothetical protein
MLQWQRPTHGGNDRLGGGAVIHGIRREPDPLFRLAGISPE